MIVGHTKFSSDRHFGTLKKKIKAVSCQSIIDLVGHNGIVNASGHGNLVLTYKNPYSKIKNFEWYDWDSFLKTKFTACTGIHSLRAVKVKKELDRSSQSCKVCRRAF